MSNENDMKPCPFCGSDQMYHDETCGIHYIKCAWCGAEGPMFNDDDDDDGDGVHEYQNEARKLWNERFSTNQHQESDTQEVL